MKWIKSQLKRQQRNCFQRRSRLTMAFESKKSSVSTNKTWLCWRLWKRSNLAFSTRRTCTRILSNKSSIGVISQNSETLESLSRSLVLEAMVWTHKGQPLKHFQISATGKVLRSHHLTLSQKREKLDREGHLKGIGASWSLATEIWLFLYLNAFITEINGW